MADRYVTPSDLIAAVNARGARATDVERLPAPDVGVDTPKTLAARRAEAPERIWANPSAGTCRPAGSGVWASDVLYIRVDAVDRLPAPNVGVGLTRCDVDYGDMVQEAEGRFVRYEDVAPLLAAARAVPADVELPRDEMHRISVETSEVAVRLLGEIIELVTNREDEPTWGTKIATLIRDELSPREVALAASTAREKAKDAEIERLREALKPFADVTNGWNSTDDGSRVIYSVGGWDFVTHTITVADCRRAAALSGRKSDTKEGT